MMKRVNGIVAFFFFPILYISSLFITNVFAIESQFQSVEKLVEKDTTAPAETIVRPKQEYKAEGLRDPFQSPIVDESIKAEGTQGSKTKEIPAPALTIQGIIWGGNINQAIINNELVKTGDTIKGARIVSIDKHGVTVFFEGREYKLLLPIGRSTSEKK